MTADINSPGKPWQCYLVGPREKLNALFYNGNFSDLTITFPGQYIEYKAHRLIMGVSSSIFERMLFGPMAIKGSELELPYNPEAFKIVLGSCYEVDIEPSNVDVATLADTYVMEQLGKKCAQHIGSKMTADINNRPEKPWQCSLVGPREKLNALFYNGNFSDLTITFPGQFIEYKAHRLIMAVSSSIFEGMLFGPMAIKGSELEIPVDYPEAFKIVLGCCYEVDIEPADIDVALNVYTLADKYVMEQLRKKCAQHIGKMLNSENVNRVLEFATHFKFHSLKATCFQALEKTFQIDKINAHKILLVIQSDWLQELQEADIKISHLEFQDSWRYPNEILCDDIAMELLKSNCYPGIRKFSGCVSAKVVSNICWNEEKRNKDDFYNMLCLSFIDQQQAKEVIRVLFDGKFTHRLSIHLQCNVIPADCLMHLPVKQLITEPELLISDVDNHGIEWVVSAACSLMPQDHSFNAITLPKSKLTISGLKTLMIQLAIACVKYDCIVVCSSKLSSDKEDELTEWLYSVPEIDDFPCILLYDRNEDISGW